MNLQGISLLFSSLFRSIEFTASGPAACNFCQSCGGSKSSHLAVSTLHTGPSPQLLEIKDVYRQPMLPIGLSFLSLKQKHPDYTKENDCLFFSIPKAPQSTLHALYLMFKILLCSYAQVDVSESCLTYVCVCGAWHIVGA